MTTSTDKIFAEIQQNFNASKGVIWVRTREPQRFLRSCISKFNSNDWVIGEDVNDNNIYGTLPFGIWDWTRGLSTYCSVDSSYTREDGTRVHNVDTRYNLYKPYETENDKKEIIKLFHSITEFTKDKSGDIKHKPDDYVTILNNFHWAIKKNPMITQWIMNLADEYSTSSRRLVLVMPYDVEVPAELQGVVKILDFESPSMEELSHAFSEFLKNEGIMTNFKEAEIQKLAKTAKGLTLVEFEDALSGFFVSHPIDAPVTISAILHDIQNIKTEALKNNSSLRLLKPELMENVGGLDELKKWIEKRKVCFSEEAREQGIEPLKGMLLAGGPGTGKSLYAKAVSAVMDVPLVNFDLASLFNKYVGGTEGKIQAALKLLKELSPCVCVVEEVDKVFSSNSNDSSGVSQRMLGTLLSWMQEENENVFFIFTANRIKNLPAELLRKGRLDALFYVPLPSEKERLEVLKIHLKKRSLPTELDGLTEVAKSSDGYCQSELEAAVKEALVDSYTESRDITSADIEKNLKSSKALSVIFKDDHEEMTTWASNSAICASSSLTTVVEPVKPRKRKVARPERIQNA